MNEEREPTRTRGNTRPLIYLAACALFACASFASVPIVRGAQSLVGVHAERDAGRAWFVNPNQADRGLRPGTRFAVDVVPGTTGRLTVVESCGDVRVGAVSVPGRADSRTRLHLVARAGCSSNWLALQVAGLVQPLRVWVR